MLVYMSVSDWFAAFVKSIKLKKCDRSSSPRVHDYCLEVMLCVGYLVILVLLRLGLKDV